jgi:transposase
MKQASTPIPSPSSKRASDLDQVRDLLRSLLAEGRTEEAIDVALTMLGQLQAHNTDLVLQLAKFRREQSGRRSERIDPAQLSLLLELAGPSETSEESDRTATEEEDAALTAERDTLEAEAPLAERGQARRRRPSPALPREVTRHELSEKERLCADCGEVMPAIGVDVSEVVELVPAHFRVEEHRRVKYACGKCKSAVKTAPGPPKLIEKGLAGPGLLAHVAMSKFQDHLPLNRLVEIYYRGGFATSVSTLCGWVAAVAEEVAPIVERIRQKAFTSVLLQTDGSGLKVLDRDDPEGIRKGTMWCMVGDRRYAVFLYARDGTGEEGPWQYLKGREGYVQADASNIFDRLYNGDRAQAIEVGCWAHNRRKLRDLLESDPRVAYPLKLIAQIYRVEDLADRRHCTPEQRVELRRNRSRAITERYHRWVRRTLDMEPPSSTLAKACAYSINHWTALLRFLEDGRLSLDNNLCELQIRSLAVGRRNYLFAGSDAGAEHAATLYSLLRTCALHGIDTYAYLVDLLRKLAGGWPDRRIDELLPESWAATQVAESTEAAPVS